MGDDKSLVLVVLICCSTIVSIIGLILGAVSLSQGGAAQLNIYTQSSTSTGSTSTGSSESAIDKIWMISIGHLQSNIEYLDPVSYQIKGYSPDVIDAVCDLANKNCELVWDVYSNCWDSTAGQRPRGGRGLMSGWYDACTGWAQAYNRLLTFSFSRPFQKVDKVAFFARNDSTIDYNDLTGLTVGFIDGWFSDEFCVGRYSEDGIVGSDLAENQIIHYASQDQLVQAVINGGVDLAFTTYLSDVTRNLKRVTPDDLPTRCVAAGPSMMTQKRNTEFVRWWDEAFGRLVGTKRYDDICQNVLREHAEYPGDHPEELCIGY